MTAGVAIRDEEPGDGPAIREVNEHAFGRRDEADLVDRLRADGEVVASLVVLQSQAQEIVGHIPFGRLPIELGDRVIAGAALAPMAVRPHLQRRGIGTALVRAGLERCRERAVEAVIVLGHSDYYPRFGFSSILAQKLQAPFSGPAFMALELSPGALARGGRVRYPSAFTEVAATSEVLVN